MRKLLALAFIGALVAGCGSTASTGVPSQPSTELPTGAHKPPPTIAATIRPTSNPTQQPTIAQTVAPSTAPSEVPPSPPSSSPLAWPAGITAHAALSAGNDLGYLEYLPADYSDDDSLRPLLVFVHDTGETGTGTETDLQNVLARGLPKMFVDGTWPAEQPFVVLMPQMPPELANAHCNFGDGLDAFLGNALQSYRIDPARIYLTGISCGGIALWDFMALPRTNGVAAVVPIASAPYPYAATHACYIARMPNWTFHGALDDLIPVHFAEDAIAEIGECTDPAPKDLKLTVYPDAGHDDVSDRIYDGSAGDDIYSWMLDHQVQLDQPL